MMIPGFPDGKPCPFCLAVWGAILLAALAAFLYYQKRTT